MWWGDDGVSQNLRAQCLTGCGAALCGHVVWQRFGAALCGHVVWQCFGAAVRLPTVGGPDATKTPRGVGGACGGPLVEAYCMARDVCVARRAYVWWWCMHVGAGRAKRQTHIAEAVSLEYIGALTDIGLEPR